MAVQMLYVLDVRYYRGDEKDKVFPVQVAMPNMAMHETIADVISDWFYDGRVRITIVSSNLMSRAISPL